MNIEYIENILPGMTLICLSLTGPSLCAYMLLINFWSYLLTALPA